MIVHSKLYLYPVSFNQLYTIHGKVNGKVVPLVYILLCNRTKITYKKILNALKDAEIYPARIMCDFELAFIKAIQSVFPECIVKGCLFHMRQALWRNVRDCGLQIMYRENSAFARNLRQLFALALVPIDDVIPAFEALISTSYYENHEYILEEFLDYFEKNWIGQTN